MGCGCGDGQAEARTTLHARALMGAACRRRRGATCQLTGRTCREHVARGHCPRRRFPDAQGRVRWLGLAWLGVPAPIRWLAATRLGRAVMGGIPRPAPPAGCGCTVAGKAVWARLTLSGRT